MAITDRLTETLGVLATMGRARLLAPMRPDKYLRIAAAMQRENMGITSGFAAAAQRCPDRPGLVDELGTLTWREIDQRADALAGPAGFEERPAPARCRRRGGSESSRHHGAQPPRLRRGIDRRQPDRR